MTHTEKLIKKTKELKAQNTPYEFAIDDLCAYHKQLFLYGDLQAREEFNKQNELKSFARPEKSYWRVYEIFDKYYD